MFFSKQVSGGDRSLEFIPTLDPLSQIIHLKQVFKKLIFCSMTLTILILISVLKLTLSPWVTNALMDNITSASQVSSLLWPLCPPVMGVRSCTASVTRICATTPRSVALSPGDPSVEVSCRQRLTSVDIRSWASDQSDNSSIVQVVSSVIKLY